MSRPGIVGILLDHFFGGGNDAREIALAVHPHPRRRTRTRARRTFKLTHSPAAAQSFGKAGLPVLAKHLNTQPCLRSGMDCRTQICRWLPEYRKVRNDQP